jgi:O-antigen/teichoic acid export membrane protein
MRGTQERRELYINTIAAWGWAQGTLVASILALPLLTRFLPKPEFGLWTQVLSLVGLATLADFGMSLVFFRRLASTTGQARGANLKAATAFYGISAALLGVVLVGLCLVPGGLVAPFLGTTELPRITAIVIILPIIVNHTLQPYALRILSSGRLDLERVFGAGPAVVGTLAMVVAAFLFGTALAVGVTYALTEIGFNVALVIVVRRSPAFGVERAAAGRLMIDWWNLMKEAWGILMIGLIPQLTLVIDAAIVGHVVGPTAVAIYVVALRVADLVPRFFSPFTESLFVSLVRAEDSDKSTVEKHATSLPWLVLTSGIALGCALVAVGRDALNFVFGAGYGRGVAASVVLIIAATLRGMYMPGIRRLQAREALGSLPRWFVGSVAAQVALALVLTRSWSILGTAVSVLIVALVLETLPAAWALRQHISASTRLSDFPITQVGTSIVGGAAVLFLAWWRLTNSRWSVIVSAMVALALGSLALRQLVRYLSSSRLVVARV